ncbi:MAG: DUF1559 domain-containing protein [Planctomycetaceae bacterium]|jgi:hypothetical protein|nr:DUF1559 domain-containing protein [Planctomycetaceae bacterium]
MKKTQILLPVAALAFWFVMPQFTVAQTLTAADYSPQVQKILEPISQMIDANTFLVGHIDLTRIDAETSAAVLKTNVATITTKLFSQVAAEEDKEEFQKKLQSAFQQLDIWANRTKARIAEIRALGCNEIYILGNSKIMTVTPLQLVLPASADKLELLEKMLVFPEDSPVGWVFQRNGDLLVANLIMPFSSGSLEDANIGSRVAFQHKLIRPSIKPELAAGLERVKNAPVKLVFAPDGVISGLWKVSAGLYPFYYDDSYNGFYNMISNISGLASATEHLQWSAIGLDLSRSVFAVTVQAKSPESAQELHDLIIRQKTLFAIFTTFSQPRRNRVNDFSDANNPLNNFNAVSDFAMLFLPEVREDQLQLVVDQERLQNAMEQIAGTYSAMVLPSMESSRKTECANNLKTIILAMHTYHDATRSFPTAYTTNKEGKPMFSWRVALLPYFEQQALYAEIQEEQQKYPDESWDGEHFKKFHSRCPKVYQCPSVKNQASGMTNYSVIVGKITSKEQADALGLRYVENQLPSASGEMSVTGRAGAVSSKVNKNDSSNVLGVSSAFPEPNKWYTFALLSDGTSNTIAVVERKEPVCWMDPSQEITIEDAIKYYNTEENKVGSSHKGGFFFALFDGSVHFWETAKIPISTWKACITCNGGESVSPPTGK